jgi:hypothetical protein
VPSLPDSVKEEREVERLIERGKPPNSRKHRPKRGPKHDNRRQKMKVDDSDLDKSDSDLSMNYKVIGGSNLADIALRIFAADDVKPDVEKIKQQVSEINKRLKILQLPKLIKSDFLDYIKKNYLDKIEHEPVDLKKALEIIKKTSDEYDDEKVDSLYGKLTRLDGREEIINFFAGKWPFGPGEWGKKAAFIYAIERAVKRLEKEKNFPAYVANLFKKKDKHAIQDLIEGAGKGSLKKLRGSTALEFAVLTAIKNVIDESPFNVDPGTLESGIEKEIEKVYDELLKLKQIEIFMKEWQNATSEISKLKSGEPWTYEQGFDKAIKGLDKLMEKKSEGVDISEVMEGFRKDLEHNGKLPKQLERIFEPFSRAASNKNGYSEPMNKTATFHGYIHQGHPEGPFPGWQSLDKRFFTEENYKSIIKFAGDLLKQDWFKSGWDGGAPDAKMRAALDLSIQIADDNLYQSKIDVETYNLLLSQLTGSKIDLFSETMYVNPDGKKMASTKRQSVQNLLRLANDLREKDPKQALQIVKDIRTLIANDEPSEEDGSESKTSQDTADVDVEELKKVQKELDEALNKEDIEALVEAFNEMGKTVKKVSSRRRIAFGSETCNDMENMEVTPPSVLPTPPGGGGAQSGSDIELKGLANLEEEDQEKLLEEIKKGMKPMSEALDKLDIDAFMKGFQSIGDVLGRHASSMVKDVDSLVNTLIRVAHKHPETRKVLLPIIVAAKKKKKKKPAPKKEEKPSKKEEKAEKAPSEKAPPFGGKKAPPFGGKKVSTRVTPNDMKW